MNPQKIKSLANLMEELSIKRASLKITACSGSFDILHSGHISYLTEARACGDILVVFVNSDMSVQLYKGPNRPIIPLHDRMVMLSALSFVDYIVPFDSLTPIEQIEKLQPEVFCNGIDWGESPIEKSIVERYGGVFKIVSAQTRGSISTSEIIQKAHEAFKQKSERVVMLDRDGVLIIDKGYVYKPTDVEILESTIYGLKKLRDAGFIFLVITNQSGIGRGMYKESDMHSVHHQINTLLQRHGIHIKKYYFCPHTPDDACNCRKPKTGLFETAAQEFGISLSKAWMIGDKLSDIEAGRRANMKTILISQSIPATDSLTTPTFIVKDFSQIDSLILNN